ncbi:SH3 domain-containing protein [Lacinutrix jangbogonensis]|uniref:SH3 domain-containing protein n=1 Tax=Lacinutrix jangbogonensis TaxID=1469557 RepID=UPI00053EB02B|nr:SH3 domain-containing protein [Lacinutrix jangbogonensis]
MRIHSLIVLRHSIICLTFFSFFFACQNNSKSKEITPVSIPEINKPIPETVDQNSTQITEDKVTDKLLFSWVDNLNIRSEPNSKSNAIAVVNKDDALTFTGETSDEKEIIVLRSLSYNEFWLKVVFNNKEGWVFGGAVKYKDEIKGNDIIDDTHLNFQHFGTFNLKEWEKINKSEESGGDYMGEFVSYKKGNQILKVENSDLGDYGYGRKHQLFQGEKLLRERDFSFSADEGIMKLKETVKIYTSNPPKQFSRNQNLDKHFGQLNALPMLVNGVWKGSDIK